MELSIQAFILGFLYHISGSLAFRIGNVVPNKLSISVPNLLQDEKAQNNWLKRTDTFHSFDRLKRFFEFNPAAFKTKTDDIQLDINRKRLFPLLPFMPRFYKDRQNTDSKTRLFPPYNSGYVKPNANPKYAKPYVDHFSGISSFVLHLQNRLKDNSDLNADKDRPNTGISMRAFLKPDKTETLDLMLDHEEAKLNKDSEGSNTFQPISDTVASDVVPVYFEEIYPSNDYHPNEEMNQQHDNIIKDTNLNSQYSHQHPYTEENVIQNGVRTDVVESISPLQFGGEMYEDGNILADDNLNADNLIDENSNNPVFVNFANTAVEGGENIIAPNVHQRSDEFETVGIVLPSNQDAIHFEFKDLHNVGQHNIPAEDITYFDTNNYQSESETFQDPSKAQEFNPFGSKSSDFGGFGSVIEPYASEPYNPEGSFGLFKEDNSDPYFGTDYTPTEDDYTYGGQFGQFSSDDSDCDVIDTKTCSSDTECSCYGLYRCFDNACVSTETFGQGSEPDNTDVGYWHEEPIEFDYRRK